jgi:xanthine dehydrogenase accessory factor
MAVWTMLRDALAEGQKAALIVVVESIGSSPGRAGFKMAVLPDGRMCGSIGGGIMEHKFVEYVRDRLHKGGAFQEIRRQVHSKEVAQDQSGMICSGEQTLLLQSLDPEALPAVQLAWEGLQQGFPIRLLVQAGRFSISSDHLGEGPRISWKPDAESWEYAEVLGRVRKAFVVGGGHVGVALCQVLKLLDYHVVNIDDRAGLNTMEANIWADEIRVLPYESLGAVPDMCEDSVVVLVSFGYRTDEVCLRQLLGRKLGYLGMMGSKAKVKAMMNGFLAEGIPKDWLDLVHAPAGLPIGSKTPMEIAVAIAAELIALKS